MANPLVFKITDYVERDLRYEEEECRALGLPMEALQLKTASPAELEVLPGVREAVVALKRAGFTALVVTNQPDVARGTQRREVVESPGRALLA